MIEKYIVFQLRNEEYAIPVITVKSIEKFQPITRVPRTLPYIRGVMNLRGVVTPIIDLRQRFGLPSPDEWEDMRIIITSTSESDLGFIVDAANDVLDVESDQIEPASNILEMVDTEFIEGVIKIENRLITILKLNELISNIGG
ncbi:MAG: chemotaxis protein CheW [Bacilli bacterium]